MTRPPSELSTERLLLRPPGIEDAEDIFGAYASDPEVTRYLIWPPYSEVEDLRAYLEGSLANREGGDLFAWQILSREGEMLGSVALRLEVHRASVGYVLARAHWGKGIMVEALRPIVGWALAQPEIHRVWAVCDVDNPASGRVLEKLGFEREGPLLRWIVHPNVSEVPRDCLSYSIVKTGPP